MSTTKLTKLNIPKSLRKKCVSSKVSREIFFVDCINDLICCVNSEITYHLTRSSVLLRMLLLDGGLNTISENYNFNLLFHATENKIDGTPLAKHELEKIHEILSEHISSFKTIVLGNKPSKEYTLEDFTQKICLKMKGKSEYNFSVKNIINLISNKHGAAHLESKFNSSTIDSFLFINFSPFSITDDNYFIEKIKEITQIMLNAIYPLGLDIANKLAEHDKQNSQSGIASSVFTVVKSKVELNN